MNLQTLKKDGSLAAFLRRVGPGVRVLENETEDLVEQLMRGKKPKLYGMANPTPQSVQGRLEENYLHYTRRFPNNVANNTIGSGAVVAGDYLYFINGVGDTGTSAGYFSIANLTFQQTNMASGGKIPSGRGFAMYDLGVSFNAMAVPNDIAQCLDSMNLRFEKQNQSLIIQHGALKLWPGGTGLYGFAATTATTTTLQGGTNGVPAMTNVRRFRNPRTLSANEQFQYVINAQANLPRDNVAVALSGFVEITVWLFGWVLDRIPN